MQRSLPLPLPTNSTVSIWAPHHPECNSADSWRQPLEEVSRRQLGLSWDGCTQEQNRDTLPPSLEQGSLEPCATCPLAHNLQDEYSHPSQLWLHHVSPPSRQPLGPPSQTALASSPDLYGGQAHGNSCADGCVDRFRFQDGTPPVYDELAASAWFESFYSPPQYIQRPSLMHTHMHDLCNAHCAGDISTSPPFCQPYGDGLWLVHGSNGGSRKLGSNSLPYSSYVR
ncbi:hypothetical protein B0H14DRAFT_3565954 [Mycena olivaceomarginata]|nr:hypothetical protein B0H14DRAFT_3565954 [Mycena olivaceomarginata]